MPAAARRALLIVSFYFQRVPSPSAAAAAAVPWLHITSHRSNSPAVIIVSTGYTSITIRQAPVDRPAPNLLVTTTAVDAVDHYRKLWHPAT